MGKAKTRKTVSKRFKTTASGKLKRQSSARGHLFTGKSRKVKRQRRRSQIVSKSDEKRLLPYI